MFATIGAALGALSTVTSLIDTAATGLGKAIGGDTAPTPFPATAPAAHAKPHAALKASGGAAQAFDKATLSAMLALQEQHRAGKAGA